MPEDDKKKEAVVNKNETSTQVADTSKKEEAKATKVAEAGKEKKKPLTKIEIKNMSKLKAQKIINEKDPELLQKIEAEVAAKAKVIKRRVMIVGAVIIIVAIAYIIYNEMQRGKRSSIEKKSQQIVSVN